MTGVTLVSNLTLVTCQRLIDLCGCRTKLQHNLPLLFAQTQKFQSVQQSLSITDNSSDLQRAPGRKLHLERDDFPLGNLRDEYRPQSTLSEIAGPAVHVVVSVGTEDGCFQRQIDSISRIAPLPVATRGFLSRSLGRKTHHHTPRLQSVGALSLNYPIPTTCARRCKAPPPLFNRKLWEAFPRSRTWRAITIKHRHSSPETSPGPRQTIAPPVIIESIESNGWACG